MITQGRAEAFFINVDVSVSLVRLRTSLTFEQKWKNYYALHQRSNVADSMGLRRNIDAPCISETFCEKVKVYTYLSEV